MADKTTLLATIREDEKPSARQQGPAYHAQGQAEMNIVFGESGGGVAYTVEKGGLTHVVHNGVAGKPYKTVGYVVLSPDGKHVAYRALENGLWRMVVDGAEGPAFNAAQLVAFSPDGRHVAYQAMKGERWYLVVDTTLNAGTRTRFQQHLFSGDSSKIAYTDDSDENNDGRLVVSDIGFRGPKVVEAKGVTQIVANEDKTRVAAIVRKEGKQRVIVFPFADPGSRKEGRLYDAIANLGFGPDGVSVTYMAERDGKRFIIFNDREEPLADGSLAGPLVVRPDQKGVGAILASGNKYCLQQFFVGGGESEKGYEEAAFLAYSRDGSRHAYAARSGQQWFIVADGKEGPPFDRVVTPQFSPDGKYLVYRARRAGKRFVVVADTSGKILREHPAYEQVFDVKFTADGKSVAYGVNDGENLIWKVEKL
ncbi:MAG TPA: hypothetical protein VI298_09450 [Geobacteraceae bacterium]